MSVKKLTDSGEGRTTYSAARTACRHAPSGSRAPPAAGAPSQTIAAGTSSCHICTFLK